MMYRKKKITCVCISLVLAMMLTLSASAAMVFIEAESGTQGSIPMLTGSGSGAFNGSYIYGEENGFETIKYEFDIPEAGDYYLWFRLQGDDDESNSFFVQIDGQGFQQDSGMGAGDYYTFDMWEPSEGYDYSEANIFLPALDDHKNPDWIYNPNWHWIPLAYRDQTVDPPVRHNLVTQNFTAGKHTMEIMTREPGCKLDKIFITNDLSIDPRSINGDPEAHFAAIAAAEAEAVAALAAAAAALEEVAAPVAEVAPAPVAAPAPAPQTSDNLYLLILVSVVAAAAVSIKKRGKQNI